MRSVDFQLIKVGYVVGSGMRSMTYEKCLRTSWGRHSINSIASGQELCGSCFGNRQDDEGSSRKSTSTQTDLVVYSISSLT